MGVYNKKNLMIETSLQCKENIKPHVCYNLWLFTI